MKTVRKFGITLAAAMMACVSLPHGAFADRCEPNAILRQNAGSFQSNLVVWLASMQNLMQGKEDRSNTVNDFAGVGLTFADAKGLTEFISKQANYTVSSQQSVSVLRTTLPPESVKAYVTCAAPGTDVFVEVPDSALSEEKFQIFVSWAPKAAGKKSQKLRLTVTNGTFEGELDPISPGERVPVEITRELDKTLFISAKVSGQSDSVSLPPKPSFSVRLRDRVEPPLDEKEFVIKSGGDAPPDAVSSKLCINADNGTSLLPSTLIFKGRIYGDPRRARYEVPADISNLTTCMLLQASTIDRKAQNAVVGRMSVWQASIVPIEDAPASILGGGSGMAGGNPIAPARPRLLTPKF